MTSEPIERRVSYIGDRLRGSRCILCGREYFRTKDYCGKCGRKSFGKMEEVDFFYEKGKLEVCTLIKEPTNKFTTRRRTERHHTNNLSSFHVCR